MREVAWPEEEGSIVIGKILGGPREEPLMKIRYSKERPAGWLAIGCELPYKTEQVELVTVVRIGWGEEND